MSGSETSRTAPTTEDRFRAIQADAVRWAAEQQREAILALPGVPEYAKRVIRNCELVQLPKEGE